MQPLSSPLEDLRARYEVLVIGSGYGGGIAASRLARAGYDVALLERGRELHPGEYPRGPLSAVRQFRLSSRRWSLGDRRNMISIHADEDLNVMSGCGLGGTSLVNSGVALRPDPRVFEDERWPRNLRENLSELELGFERAECVLSPSTYPSDRRRPAKLAALAHLADPSDVRMAPVNIEYSYHHDAYLAFDACTGCGDCNTGCNVGSKRTTLATYLPDAVAHGARIFTEMDVRYLERTGAGWRVHVEPLGLGRGLFDAPPMAIGAEQVVVAAGSLGSTELLLRSAALGLPLSSRLGERVSGNGDFIGFVHYRSDAAIPIDRVESPGPSITGYVDLGDGRPVSEGLIVQDGTIPGALAPLVGAAMGRPAFMDWAAHHRDRLLGRRRAQGMASRRPPAIARTRTILMMGQDDTSGRMRLYGDRLRIDWPLYGSAKHYSRAQDALDAIASSSGGIAVDSLIWRAMTRGRHATSHPMGGCAMAERAEDGVVDHRGRVFARTEGEEVHPGLHVWDGAAVPMALGINPLLTISALAERAAALLVEEEAPNRGNRRHAALQVTGERAKVPSPGYGPVAQEVPQGESPPPGIRFTERMTGTIEGVGPVAFELTLFHSDARTASAQLESEWAATGTVEMAGLDPAPLMVEHGIFQLLVPESSGTSHGMRMWYRLPLATADGRRFYLEGFKTVRPGTLLDLWPSTTTLFVVLRRDGPDGPAIGEGVMRISPSDFLRQMASNAVTGPTSGLGRMTPLVRFDGAFAKALWQKFGRVLPPSRPATRDAALARRRRTLTAPQPVVHPYRTADGVELRLTRYEGGKRGPIVLSHGLGANPLTFSTDTIGTNLVEYLTGHGFDVWLQEWRGSTLLDTAWRDTFTGEDVVANDHPAAEAAVRAITGRDELHWVTHCVGTMTALMATLAGTIHPSSIFCSQVGVHSVVTPLMRAKIKMGAGPILNAMRVRRLTTDSFDDSGLVTRLVDQVLRLHPVPKGERCDHAVCRRLVFTYGTAVHHSAVDDDTHEGLHELFGPANLTMLRHLSKCAVREHLVGADGAELYLRHLDRLQLPMTFLHGAHNKVWVPESTQRTYDVLTSRFGPDNYRRVVLEEHGHQDCLMGFDAVSTGFPVVLDHLVRAGA